MKIIIIIFLSCAFLHSYKVFGNTCPNNRKTVVCYWGSWAVYRPTPGKHKLELIDAEYCTHLVYAFAGLNLNGDIDSLDYNNDITMGTLKKFVEIKEKYPCVKILLAIGGWNEGSEKYSFMVETEERRKSFVTSVMRFLIHFGFDGLDIDWTYPTQRNGLIEDRENFIEVLKLLHKQLKRRNRMLTAAVSASLQVINTAYNISEMCNYLDLVNIMGYDMQYLERTSAHAPLKRERTESANRETLEIIIQHYIDYGCPKEKLVLGIPAFGRSFTLRSTYTSGINAPVTGPGNPGYISQTKGFLGFNEICANITTDKGWRIYHLMENAAKYAYKGDQWISYDDPDTVKQKAQYVLKKGLAGVMLWSIDTDDFHGVCYSDSYPLLVSANSGLGNKINTNIK